MSTHEQKPKEKKDHPIIVGVTVGVLTGMIMLFVNTISSLVLAHIWPVTIHFGEYSLANVIYIMISVLTSVVVSYLAFYLGWRYIRISSGRAIERFLYTPEQLAAKKKRSWLDRAIDGLGFVFMLPIDFIRKRQEKRRYRQISRLLPYLMAVPPQRLLAQFSERQKQEPRESEE